MTAAAAASAANPPASPKFETIARKHAADAIFEQLAASILRREFPAGASLPPERELAEQFGVSRTIARQALHRVADLGLVRVRQGGATVVQDFSRSSDNRILELRYRLGPTSALEERDMFERRILEGFALIQLASWRATSDQLAALKDGVDDFAARGAPEAEFVAFEQFFWMTMAEATHNRLYIGQSAWWNRMVAQRGSLPTQKRLPPVSRAAFYKEVVHRMIEGYDAAQFFLDTVRPILSGVAAPVHTPEKKKRR